MNESPIYKRLSGGQKRPYNKIVGYALIGFFIFSIVSSLISGATNGAAWGLALGLIAAAAVTAFYARFAIKWTKQEQRKIDKRFELIERIGDAEWNSMDDQMARKEFWFDTFYQLEDYLYVPKERLLIRYTDIKLFKTVLHRTNGVQNGVHIEITDEEELISKFYVKKWREYLDFQQKFMDAMNEKKARQAMEQPR